MVLILIKFFKNTVIFEYKESLIWSGLDKNSNHYLWVLFFKIWYNCNSSLNWFGYSFSFSVSLVEFWRFWERIWQSAECSWFYGYLASCGAVRNLWTQATINRFDSKIKVWQLETSIQFIFFIRELAGFFSIRLGGYPQFVRPLSFQPDLAASLN